MVTISISLLLALLTQAATAKALSSHDLPLPWSIIPTGTVGTTNDNDNATELTFLYKIAARRELPINQRLGGYLYHSDCANRLLGTAVTISTFETVDKSQDDASNALTLTVVIEIEPTAVAQSSLWKEHDDDNRHGGHLVFCLSLQYYLVKNLGSGLKKVIQLVNRHDTIVSLRVDLSQGLLLVKNVETSVEAEHVEKSVQWEYDLDIYPCDDDSRATMWQEPVLRGIMNRSQLSWPLLRQGSVLNVCVEVSKEGLSNVFDRHSSVPAYACGMEHVTITQQRVDRALVFELGGTSSGTNEATSLYSRMACQRGICNLKIQMPAELFQVQEADGNTGKNTTSIQVSGVIDLAFGVPELDSGGDSTTFHRLPVILKDELDPDTAVIQDFSIVVDLVPGDRIGQINNTQQDLVAASNLGCSEGTTSVHCLSLWMWGLSYCLMMVCCPAFVFFSLSAWFVRLREEKLSQPADHERKPSLQESLAAQRYEPR